MREAIRSLIPTKLIPRHLSFLPYLCAHCVSLTEAQETTIIYGSRNKTDHGESRPEEVRQIQPQALQGQSVSRTWAHRRTNSSRWIQHATPPLSSAKPHTSSPTVMGVSSGVSQGSSITAPTRRGTKNNVRFGFVDFINDNEVVDAALQGCCRLG